MYTIDRIVICKGSDHFDSGIGSYTMSLRPGKHNIEFRPHSGGRVFCSNSPTIFDKYYKPFQNWIKSMDETQVSFYKYFSSKAECDAWCSDTIFQDNDLFWSVFLMSGDRCLILGSYRYSDTTLPDVFYGITHDIFA